MDENNFQKFSKSPPSDFNENKPKTFRSNGFDQQRWNKPTGSQSEFQQEENFVVHDKESSAFNLQNAAPQQTQIQEIPSLLQNGGINPYRRSIFMNFRVGFLSCLAAKAITSPFEVIVQVFKGVPGRYIFFAFFFFEKLPFILFE